MARILVLQHSPYEPLGLIIHTLKQMRLRIRYVNFARDPFQRVDMRRYDGIVVLGGAMHPSQMKQYPHLAHEIELIQEAVNKQAPILGICLGSQLLNLALGGHCYELPKPEVGWTLVKPALPTPPFAALDRPLHVFQWHQYANQPSDTAQVILQNHQCVQAFTYQSFCMGLQFHLEVDAHLIRRWLQHPDYLEQLQRHLTVEEIEKIRADTKQYLANSMQVAKQLFAAFCQLFDKKKISLSSRG